MHLGLAKQWEHWSRSLRHSNERAAPTLRSLMPEPLAADTGFAALHITLRQGADVRSKYLFVRAHRGKTQVRCRSCPHLQRMGTWLLLSASASICY